MGCSHSAKVEPLDGDTAAAAAELKKQQEDALRTRNIDIAMAKAKEQDEASLKLLLLGAGESGKSTIFKQMKQIYNKSYESVDSRRPFVRIIHHNVVQAMKTLVEQAGANNLALEQTSVNSAQYMMESVRLDDTPNAHTFAHIKTLWRDKGIRACYDMRARFQLIDTCNRLFDRMEEIASERYVPSYEDILHARARTSGITETAFEEKNNRFVLLDVGGQKNERKKWIHSFEGVTGVIFVVGLSEYDQLMFEDLQTNRMHDAVQLFDEICNLKWFRNTAMLLFLNKRDLFQDKVRKVDLAQCFPEYSGGLDYENAIRFLVEKFTAQNRTKKKVYYHVTCATDQSNVAFTFNACKSIIVEHGLRHAGLVGSE